MRICMYTETALPKMGGHELVVDALARQFLAQGHEPIVLAPYPRLPLWPRDRLLPYPVVRHPRFYSTRNFVSWYRWFLLRAWKRYRFDVLHCHGLYPQGYLSSLVADRLPLPIVLTSHGGDLFAGSIRVGKPGIRDRVVRGLVRADALVAISKFTHDGFLRLHPRPRRLVDIPNGVHLEPLQVRVPAPEQGAAIVPGQYFLFVGRLKRRKGVDLLLQAFANMGPQPYQLVIAGDGEEREALESLARELKLSGRVHFTGAVSGDHKAYLLQNAFCGVLPSRQWEAFPLVLLELQAGGAPVIASRLPGIAELIAPGETGWHVEPEQVGDLTRSMLEAVAQPDETRRRGQLARQRVQAFGWPLIAKRHLSLYEELLDERRGAIAKAG